MHPGSAYAGQHTQVPCPLLIRHRKAVIDHKHGGKYDNQQDNGHKAVQRPRDPVAHLHAVVHQIVRMNRIEVGPIVVYCLAVYGLSGSLYVRWRVAAQRGKLHMGNVSAHGVRYRIIQPAKGAVKAGELVVILQNPADGIGALCRLRLNLRIGGIGGKGQSDRVAHFPL